MKPVIIDAIRTPRGRGSAKGGALSDIRAADLLGGLFAEMSRRYPGVETVMGDTLIGCVTQVGDQGSNIGKVASLRAGWPATVPGATINRFCASGLSAVNAVAAQAQINDSMTIGGGVEMMSRTPMFADDGVMFADKDFARSVQSVHPVLGADLVASLYDISRADCDAYAALSQTRAEAARARGAFPSIVPVHDAQGTLVLDQDETIRSGVTAGKLAVLDPVFEKVGTKADVDALLSLFPDLDAIQHVHHAGNAPAMADGAALVLLGSPDAADRQGLTPRARILSTAEANVAITQTGAVDASRLALHRAGLDAGDIDLWEVRDSFAAVTLHYVRSFDLDLDMFNVNGSSIALGHPMGATGAMLIGTLLDELDARDQRYGLVAIAGAAGVASAAVIERLTP
ncbi:acetyl-CoA C-acyltransferase [Thalassorhabdomicrobium marinisediminis]|uniref:acetyl-CoA C-acyltransferase n=1 Tax=Thalassorhabdomicrobium marinisediminis TaxID=2170577 RepID=UPI0024908FB7|nr:acetyl-CoA C-acyltransferase [Thalassorhabdomicrobium marinisediminis]